MGALITILEKIGMVEYLFIKLLLTILLRWTIFVGCVAPTANIDHYFIRPYELHLALLCMLCYFTHRSWRYQWQPRNPTSPKALSTC
jgi:hypothetical protein